MVAPFTVVVAFWVVVVTFTVVVGFGVVVVVTATEAHLEGDVFREEKNGKQEKPGFPLSILIELTFHKSSCTFVRRVRHTQDECRSKPET